MARIRSLHPTQWTDDEFVTSSPLGRLLCLGLRNEADDQGVFPWKPVTLKMRLLPNDNVDVSELLAELVENNQVKSFEVDGKKYGVIRNFGRFQSPKKPNYTYPLPNELRTYAGFEEDKEGGNSEPVPNQFGTSEKKSRQREVDKEEEKKELTPLISGGDQGVIENKGVVAGVYPTYANLPRTDGGHAIYPEAFEAFWKAFPRHKNDDKGGAYNAWRQAQSRRGVTSQILIDGAKGHAGRISDRPPDKRPYVQTWINRGGWELAQGEAGDADGDDEPIDQWAARYKSENRTDL